MRRALAALVTAFAVWQGAGAGAWTLERGNTQVFAGTTVSGASRWFDASGTPTGTMVFRKIYV